MFHLESDWGSRGKNTNKIISLEGFGTLRGIKLLKFVFLCMAENENSKLYYSIGEITERYKIRPSALHFWEKQFPELKPRRNKKGNRFYTEEDIALLDMIYYLTKVKGYTLKGARERIKADRRNIERNAAVSATLLRVKEFLSELKDGLK